MNCTIRVAKRKAQISIAITAKLICAFVFAYADCWISHAMALLKTDFLAFLTSVHVYLSLTSNDIEQRHEKTGFLPRRKQRRRSASQ